MKALKAIEYTSWAIGFALVSFYALSRSQSAVARASDIESFAEAKATLPATAPPDFTLWAEGRIRKYQESLEANLGLPMAILRIPQIDLEVPVLEGTSDPVLDRAVGRIEGTVRPGETGNSGIAGHRDGVFRSLKDIAVGDRLEIETLTGNQTYEVDKISIVDPTQVEVLAQTEGQVVTLVTCYPFYFVGNAPQRYIVRASLKNPASTPSSSVEAFASVD